jgi:mannose-6-phosphate isomerase-like protein (cupin superfamily)
MFLSKPRSAEDRLAGTEGEGRSLSGDQWGNSRLIGSQMQSTHLPVAPGEQIPDRTIWLTHHRAEVGPDRACPRIE